MSKRAIAATLSIFGAALIWTSGASASPTELTVRIEGAQTTLFEGPIETEGHDVQAISDPEPRPCDATNNGAHPEPGPTPTAASVDAMELIGERFDAEWYPGFDDYFIKQWGPDREDPEAAAYWGILAGGALTPVGGCQYLASPGEEVFWAYDVFSGRDPLWLAAADDPGYPASPTVTAVLGEPFELSVRKGAQPAPTAAAGVTVAPVATAAGSGYQTVETGSPAAVTTDAGGEASISFPTPGWHRIKAQQEAGFIRSNRLDVCVEAVAGEGCGPLPADAAVRVPPRYAEPPEEEGGGDERPPAPDGGALPPPPPPSGGAGIEKRSPSLRMRSLRANRARGTATLRITAPGPGRLVVSAPKVVRRKLRIGAPGTVRVVVQPTARGRAVLRREGRLRVALKIRFAPAGGEPVVRRRALTLRLRRNG